MPFIFPNRRGEDHPRSKLNNAQRHHIKEQLEQGAHPADLQREHHVCRSTIRRIRETPKDWLPPAREE